MEEMQMDKLLDVQNEQLRKLHEIVRDSIKEERLIVEGLSRPDTEKLTYGQKISDQVARFGGSWKFIILFGIVLSLWILYNAVVAGKAAFDPYPFILMNLVLSCIAALQAPVIMMSQNRQEEKDRLRAENDYMINLKAEIEIRSLHQKIDLLLEEQLKTLYDTQAEQYKILKNLNEKLDTLCGRDSGQKEA